MLSHAPRPHRSLLLLAIGILAVGLAACGNKEANAMTKYADQMCACKTVECVEKLLPEVEKFSKENEGKEVEASAADKYNSEAERAQKCYETLLKNAESK